MKKWVRLLILVLIVMINSCGGQTQTQSADPSGTSMTQSTVPLSSGASPIASSSVQISTAPSSVPFFPTLYSITADFHCNGTNSTNSPMILTVTTPTGQPYAALINIALVNVTTRTPATLLGVIELYEIAVNNYTNTVLHQIQYPNFPFQCFNTTISVGLCSIVGSGNTAIINTCFIQPPNPIILTYHGCEALLALPCPISPSSTPTTSLSNSISPSYVYKDPASSLYGNSSGLSGSSIASIVIGAFLVVVFVILVIVAVWCLVWGRFIHKSS